MCVSVIYNKDNAWVESTFTTPIAKLPVRNGEKNLRLITWGRRLSESGKLPLGGWVHLNSIHAGLWDEYFPKPVLLSVKKFMEYDFEFNRHWFDITTGQWMQGIIAQYNNEQRAYIVIIDSYDVSFNRWPKIIIGRKNENIRAK